jgi:hypothetical protein
MERLRRHGAILAESFHLPLRSLKPESPRVKRRYGICDEDGNIKIRLRSVRTGELLKYSSLVDTLCHELAHLKHFDHGRRFWAFYERIRNYALRRGIYRPGPERPISASVIAPVPPSLRPSISDAARRTATGERRRRPISGPPGSTPPADHREPAPQPAQLELFPL